MEDNRVIRWAVVGLGKISRRMVKAIRSVENSIVTACVSSSKERAEKYGEKYGIPNRLTYDELESDPSVCDAVYIATHMNAHAKPAVMYLNRKLPVLCEKSFAVSTAQAESMVAAAKENGTLLMEAMWTRFLPATLYLNEFLKSGEAGGILSARAKFEVGIGHGPKSRVFNRAVGGGSILDIGVYPTTYTHMILGMPESLSANGRIKNGVDTSCNAEFTYGGGIKVNTRVSTEFMTLKEYYIIECENCTIKIPSFYDARKIKIKFKNGKTVVKRFEYAPDGFSYEIRHFNSLIRDGVKESPVMTHKITLEVVSLLEEQMKQLGVNYSETLN
jgi:predicted dehydrogenase